MHERINSKPDQSIEQSILFDACLFLWSSAVAHHSNENKYTWTLHSRPSSGCLLRLSCSSSSCSCRSGGLDHQPLQLLDDGLFNWLIDSHG